MREKNKSNLSLYGFKNLSSADSRTTQTLLGKSLPNMLGHGDMLGPSVTTYSDTPMFFLLVTVVILYDVLCIYV